MRVVIADDEQWARLALREMISEADPDTVIVGEAANGEQMAEMAVRLQPDLVFVDIQMPCMDGLEGIKRAQKLSSNTVWVILSGFSDFQYTQRAISLGVTEYLLKPVSPENLRETLWKVKQRRREKAASRNEDFRNWLISSQYMEKEDVSGEKFRGLQLMGLLLCFDTWECNSGKKGYQESFSETLEKRMSELERYGNIFCTFFPSGTGKQTVVVGLAGGEGEERKEKIREWFVSLQKEFLQICDIHCALTGIHTQWCSDAAEMTALLKTGEEMGRCRIAAGIDRIWSYEEMQSEVRKMGGRRLDMCEKLMRIADGIQNGSYLHFIGCAAEAQKEWSRCKTLFQTEEYLNMKRYLAVTTGLSRILERETYRKMELGEALLVLMENAGTVLSRNVEEKPNAEPDAVYMAEEYIRAHYAEDISIAVIAQQLSLTPNYLSALFHKKTGTTFVKYLTRVRMFEAENLLQSTRLPIWKVAEQVGFNDTRYFTKIFKDYFGCLPSEYRCRKR